MSIRTLGLRLNRLVESHMFCLSDALCGMKCAVETGHRSQRERQHGFAKTTRELVKKQSLLLLRQRSTWLLLIVRWFLKPAMGPDVAARESLEPDPASWLPSASPQPIFNFG